MTCIVAVIDEKGVAHFAGDAIVVNTPSQYHSNVSQTVRREPKVWTRDGMVFGASGSVRILQLLRYEMEIPEYTAGRNKVEYLVKLFVPALQACFKKNEYPSESLGGNILLALEGELLTIGEEFNVCDTADNYDSVGKASEVAIGSLHTTGQLNLSTRERLRLALLATERHTCVVSQPFTYISSKMDQTEILAG